MKLFSKWLTSALEPVLEVRNMAAPSIFFNSCTKGLGMAKWLAYIDQYVVLTVILLFVSKRFDYIVFADHGNAPAGRLVSGKKIAAMVHDTIALRQARGGLPGAPSAGASGRMLQGLIRASLSRARFLYVNPGKVAQELNALGVHSPSVVLGCQVDSSRLSHPSPSPVVGGRYLLNVGSSGWRKRKQDLLRLWAVVQERDPDLHLVLAGRTGEEERAMIVTGRLDRVVILDDVDDEALARLYQDAQGLIVPSLYEGLCIPIIEAAHFRKRVFVAAIADYTAMFDDYVTPLDFTAPEAAAEVLLSALAQPDLASGFDGAWFSKAQFDDRVRSGLRSFLSAKHVEAWG